MKMVKMAFTEPEIRKCLEIRYQSFCVEKNVPQSIEADEKDIPGSGCRHFLIYEDGTPVGTFRLTINDGRAKLQRFCVLKKYRSHGYGSFALEFLEEYCLSEGTAEIYFDAQCTAVRFYEKNGYEVVSGEFEEAGILHVKMRKLFT